jgi:putative Holliday junction resolvase
MPEVPKVLAIDIGSVRVGVAISDGLGLLAHPLLTLNWQGKKKLSEDLKEIIHTNNVKVLVVGVPYTMKGTESIQTKNVFEIIDFLQKNLDITIEKIDERLTTKLAENMLKSVNRKTSKSRDIIDQISAINILQTYLDKTQNLRRA